MNKCDRCRRATLPKASGKVGQGFGVKKAWQYVALGGNKNSAYCHALVAYNQLVKYIGDICGNKNRKTFSVFMISVDTFLLYKLER